MTWQVLVVVVTIVIMSAVSATSAAALIGSTTAARTTEFSNCIKNALSMDLHDAQINATEQSFIGNATSILHLSVRLS